MGTIIISVILAAVIGFAVFSTVRRIRYGSSCCGSKEPMPAKIKVKDKNVACTIHLEFKWYFYVAIFAGIYLCYTVINLLLMRKLNRVSQTEVLKNRE